MRQTIFVLALLGCLGTAGPALSQENFSFGIGAVERSAQFAWTGTLRGSLVPTTEFSGSASAQADGLSLSAGHESRLGGRVFVGVEANLDLGRLEQRLLPVTGRGQATQVINTCAASQSPFGGIIPECGIFSFQSWSETQTLAATLVQDGAAGFEARIGFDVRNTQLRLTGGASMTDIVLRYELPELDTVLPPDPFVTRSFVPFIPSEGTVGATPVHFQRELREDARTLVGWSAGLSIQQLVTSTLSVTLAYLHIEYESSRFGDSPRVSDFRAHVTTDVVRLQLTVRH